MARTAQQVLESTIGQLHIQVCSLQAALDDANEKAGALQNALDAAVERNFENHRHNWDKTDGSNGRRFCWCGETLSAEEFAVMARDAKG